MAYSDYPGLRGLSASGAYGDIPNDLYMRKIERTNFDEDPDQVDNHIRGLLVDFRPDQSFLASDEARHDPHSGERLNLRYGGGRSLEDPWMEDGTFLDQEFTIKDPRSMMPGPDMQQFAKQSKARAGMHMFRNDNDYSVPETGINPSQMVSNIRSGMKIFKGQFQNFEESFDSWHNGGTAKVVRKNNHDMSNVTTDGTIIDLADATVRNRRDAVNQLSDNPLIAFRHSTTDHRYKITRYGRVRPSQSMAMQDATNNRASTYLDHAQPIPVKSEMANRMIANAIVDLEKQRDKITESMQGIDFSSSKAIANKSRRIDGNLINAIIESVQSQAATAHEQLRGEGSNRKMALASHNRELMSAVRINHEVLASMEQSTKKSKERDVKDMRDQIKQSAAEGTMFKEVFSKTGVKRGKGNSRDTIDTRHIEEEKGVKNYSGIKPTKLRSDMENVQNEDFGNFSLNTITRKGKRRGHKLKDVDDHEQEQDQGLGEFGIYDKAQKNSAESTFGRTQSAMDFGDIDRDEVRVVDINNYN